MSRVQPLLYVQARYSTLLLFSLLKMIGGESDIELSGDEEEESLAIEQVLKCVSYLFPIV